MHTVSAEAARRAKALRDYAQFFRVIGWLAFVGCVIGLLAQINAADETGTGGLAFVLLVVGVAAVINGGWIATISSGLAELLDPMGDA